MNNNFYANYENIYYKPIDVVEYLFEINNKVKSWYTYKEYPILYLTEMVY